jgi:hypothetical protein
VAQVDQIRAAAGIAGIEVTNLEAQIVGHRHDSAGSVTGAEITVDIGLGQARVLQCSFGDFGM